MDKITKEQGSIEVKITNDLNVEMCLSALQLKMAKELQGGACVLCLHQAPEHHVVGYRTSQKVISFVQIEAFLCSLHQGVILVSILASFWFHFWKKIKYIFFSPNRVNPPVTPTPKYRGR